jgi:hypothetical protein
LRSTGSSFIEGFCHLQARFEAINQSRHAMNESFN